MSFFGKLWHKIRKPLIGYATMGTVGAVLAAKSDKKQPGSVLDIHNVRRGLQYTLSLPAQVAYKATGGEGVAREVFLSDSVKKAAEAAEKAAQEAEKAANRAVMEAVRGEASQPSPYVVGLPSGSDRITAGLAPLAIVAVLVYLLVKRR